MINFKQMLIDRDILKDIGLIKLPIFEAFFSAGAEIQSRITFNPTHRIFTLSAIQVSGKTIIPIVLKEAEQHSPHVGPYFLMFGGWCDYSLDNDFLTQLTEHCTLKSKPFCIDVGQHRDISPNHVTQIVSEIKNLNLPF